MLNYIWFGLVVAAVIIGGCNRKLPQLTEAAFDSAKTAVMSVALPLVGMTALWLGLMRLADRAGLMQALAKAVRPVMQRLFPDVPPDHPAIGSMLMNIAANVLGLANAATPLGLRAMNDLQKLNPTRDTATNAMCTFLALNTSSLQLVPTTAIAVLAAAGATNPSAIVGPTLIATFCSTAVGLIGVKILERLPPYRLAEPVTSFSQPKTEEQEKPHSGFGTDKLTPWRPWQLIAVLGYAAMFVALFAGEMVRAENVSSSNWFVRSLNAVSLLSIPFLIGFFPLCAIVRGVRAYEEFVAGAKEGFAIAIRVIPFLVAMLVAIGVFRAAGGIEILGKALGQVLHKLRFPVELLPMTLTRPLSGSATIGLLADLAKTLGPDHLVTRMGGTLLGSTETTFYVIAVYFGAVSVRRVRHAVLAGLLADFAGVVASVVVCRVVFRA